MRLAVPGKTLAPAARQTLPVSQHRTNRAVFVGSAARHHGLQRSFEKDDQRIRERGEILTRSCFFKSAAAQRQYQLFGLAGVANGCGLEFAKCGFALALEDVRDGPGGARFHDAVRVDERPSQPLGEQRTDRGLARAHKAGQDNTRRMSRKGFRRSGGAAHAVADYMNAGLRG